MTEYSRMAKGSFTSTGGAKIITLPFIPDRIEMTNYSAAATPANHGVPYAKWDVQMGQGYAVESVFATDTDVTPIILTTDVVTSNGFSTFYAGLALQYGAVVAHGGTPVSEFSMTAASPVVVTTVGNHGLTSGDVVIFSNLAQTATTGMNQMAGVPLTVTVTGATTFSVPWNASGSNYTAFNTATSTGNVGSYKKVLYPYLYAPGSSIITGITTGTTTTIDTAAAHNFVVGQEVAFRIPPSWGTIQLNSLPNTVIPGSPIYGYVVSVTDYNTVVVNINSTGYTAFVPNQTFASAIGLSYPQIVAVGDVNTGGVVISSGSALYPPPFIRPIASTTVNTINGPAIQGSFFNNTSMGFIIGAGVGTNDSSSVLVGANGNVIYWAAYLDDISLP